jgi:hypothetical protein
VRQTWPSTQGAGITVAVLGTGVDPRHPDLTGSVTTGPDFSGSGRTHAGPFWGINGTEVAGAIAGHGHGAGRTDGLLGVAPMAKILSIRVSLEFNDPLNSTPAIARRLPGAIASGINYAVDHGARIIDLPLDPGTAGLTGQGSPAAAGGSAAEQAAVAYALRKNVVLVAPAGDDGQGPDLTDHPAAYTGVIAVGAIARNGQLAPFSSRHSYVSLTAPGVGLAATIPPDGYARISSTSTSSGIVAGVAALIRSRFPHLSAAQVGQALTRGATAGRTSAPGTGRGTIDAAKAVGLAASINAAAEPPRPAPTARPSQSGQRLSTTAAHRANASDLAGSLVRYVVAGLCVLIVLLVALLLVMRSRRERSRVSTAEAAPGRNRDPRPRGQHEQRMPQPVSGPVTAPFTGPVAGHQDSSRSQLAPPPGRNPDAGTGGWAATGGWQGGSNLGEMQPPPAEPFRPVIAPAPKPARMDPSPAGPPWAPAREPERTFGPLPSVPNSAFPMDPGPGIRVPADVPTMPAMPPGGMLPAPFDVNASPDPDFPPRPAPDGEPGLGRPTRQSLGFAAAPVPADYAPPQAPDFTVPSRAAGLVLSGDTAPSAAGGPSAAGAAPGPAPVSAGPAEDPSFIWDLAATDVFPAAGDPGAQTAAPGAVPEDGDPGAS